MYLLQITDTTLYLVVGLVVYAYSGAATVSPALGNTGLVLRKVAYGIALPTILISATVNGHVCAKLASQSRVYDRDTLCLHITYAGIHEIVRFDAFHSSFDGLMMVS